MKLTKKDKAAISALQGAVSNLNRNRWEGFSRRKPQPESESRGTRGGDR